ncbi:MAG: HAMP domain-containing histidine kinase [Firmicutes bacterium]|nr:HAMP domain-containing histidine kinase [Bacillota bacterium]
MHKDRLALLGQFSAGIMHEISKPLTAISLAYEQLASSTAEPSKPLRILGRGIDDLTEISRQLLTFSRPQPSRGQAVTNLSRVVADVIEIAEVLAKKKHITIEKQEVKDICVDINEQEVRQVLLNLLSNAIEATPEGGLVRVTYGKGCYAQQNDPVWEKDYLESRNTQGWLLVEDEGPGFDSVVVKKLGNAYITTKEEGHGLGLAIVFLLLKRWNARIRIYHPLTGGSSVLIEF